jgi:anti-sigma factor RsiW
MHEPIQAHIEKILDNRLPPAAKRSVEDHLAACAECAEELRAMRLHSGVMRALRVDAPEVSAGFYARVMQRIEQQSPPSFWNLLLDPIFGQRLVYATGALFLLMGAFLLATAPEQNQLAATPVQVIAEPVALPAAFAEDVQRDREQFLVTMASYAE